MLGLGVKQHGAGSVPLSIAGCQLWLRADLGVTLNGSSVSKWLDQSPNAYAFIQNTGANQPGFSVVGNAHGTGPALTFNGSSQSLGVAAFPLGTSNITLFHTVLVNVTNAAQNIIAFGNNNASQGWQTSIDINAAQQREVTCRGSGTMADDVATTSWELWTVQRDSTNWTMRVNGVATSLSGTNTPPAQVGGSTIGAEEFSTPLNFLNGSIDEIIGYNSFLTLGQVILIENYIRNRTKIW